MEGSKPVIWKDIDGYGGKYQVSYAGDIRRVYRSGKTRLLTPFKRSENSRSRKITRDRLYVHLTDDNGKSKQVPVLKIVSRTFLPPPKPGEVPYHKNGVVTDNWVSNIGFIDRQTLGYKTGYISKARAVIKIDRSGDFIEVYRSARGAAKHCFMSYQTIIDRCNGFYKKDGKKYGFKSVFAPDGFAYSWDEERYIRKTLLRIQEELSSQEIIVNIDGYDAEPEAMIDIGNVEWQEAEVTKG